MEYFPVVTFVVALLALIGMGINKLAEKVSENPKKLLVAIVVAMFLVVFLGSLAYAEESEWQGATVNGSIEVTVKGETLYFVVYTTDDGEILSYFDDTELQRGTRIKVLISQSWETLDAEVEEPEPIWFPSFLLLGAIVPVEKKFKRAQKMPPDFYLPCSLFDKNTYVVYFTNGKKCFVKVALSEALEYIRRAESKGVAAFVCTFVEAYKQQAVVACTYCDFLEYWRGTAISDKINDAYKALTVGVITNNIEPKLDIDEVMVISDVDIKDNPELYAPSPEEIAEFEAMREAYSPAGYRDF